MCSLCCLCTYPATPISNRPPAMCGQHEPPVRPAAPRFESRRCDLCQSWGEDEPDSLRYLKVANRSGTEAQTLSGGNGARAVGGMIMPPKGVQGRSPGTPLVPFVVKRKEPRVWAGQAHWWVLGLLVPQNLPGARSPSQKIIQNQQLCCGRFPAAPRSGPASQRP